MVTSCIAYGCTYRAKKGSGISFHRFPIKRPDLLKKWIQAVRRKKWIPHENSYICSAHFPESCFKRGEGKICLRLDKNAVPSIFPQFPKHLQIIEKKEENHQQRERLLKSHTNHLHQRLQKPSALTIHISLMKVLNKRY